MVTGAAFVAESFMHSRERRAIRSATKLLRETENLLLKPAILADSRMPAPWQSLTAFLPPIRREDKL